MRPRIPDCLWLLFWMAVSAVWCVTAARAIGPTFDEPFYLEQGLVAWRTGSPGGLLAKGTMPLPVVVTTAPLRAWEVIRGESIDLDREMPLALALARPATLLFWAVLLGYGWLAAYRLAGLWGGRIATPLLACEPNLLANASLATTDIALVACLLAFVYHYLEGRERGWWARVAWPGALYALALLAKASALAFAVLVMVAVECIRGWEQAGPAATWRERARSVASACLARRFRLDSVQIVLIGLTLTFVACGSGGQPERSFQKWARSLPEGRLASAMTWMSETLRIFPNAGVAIVRQIKHNMQGHGSYLLGQTSPRALWYFFPVALSIKLTLPFLLLCASLALVAPRTLANRLTALAGVFLLFSLNCRVQIGTRLVFPLVVFLVLGVSVALADAWRQAGGVWRRRLIGGLLTVTLFWMSAETVSAWPHGLQYINELWGGPGKGYERLGGSDYDWGQGVPELQQWAAGRPLGLLYYGTDPAAKGPGLHLLDPVTPVREVSPEGLREVLQGRQLAVSISLLYGPPMGTPRLQALLNFLRQRPPAARTRCFFIYHFADGAPLAAPQ